MLELLKFGIQKKLFNIYDNDHFSMVKHANLLVCTILVYIVGILGNEQNCRLSAGIADKSKHLFLCQAPKSIYYSEILKAVFGILSRYIFDKGI